MRDLLAVEMLEDALGLDARHDAGADRRERQRRARDLVALEQPVEVVLDDLLAVARIAQHHAVEVLEAEVAAIEDDMERTGHGRLAVGELLEQQRDDMRREGVGIERKIVHGRVLRLPSGCGILGHAPDAESAHRTTLQDFDRSEAHLCGTLRFRRGIHPDAPADPSRGARGAASTLPRTLSAARSARGGFDLREAPRISRSAHASPSRPCPSQPCPSPPRPPRPQPPPLPRQAAMPQPSTHGSRRRRARSGRCW